jgi:parvulin-like peptidyl-prolyl isomerase
MAAPAALTLACAALAQAPGAKPVATVNGVVITAAEMDAVLKAQGPVPVHLPEAQRKQRQMEALSMLIDNALMRQFLEKETKPVGDEEVSRRVEEMSAGLKKQNKSLEEFCQETGQTLAQLKAALADYLRWNAYVQAHVSDQDVEKFYKENKDFFDATTVRVSHIVKRLPAGASEAEKAKARETLTQLRQKLVDDPKADFAELAKQHSEDPQAKTGGDLGWIPRMWFDEAFAKAAFALPVGQVSEVVQTDFGLHLIKVAERKQGRVSNLAKEKDAVREACAEDLRQQILSKLRKDSKLTIDLP